MKQAVPTSRIPDRLLRALVRGAGGLVLLLALVPVLPSAAQVTTGVQHDEPVALPGEPGVLGEGKESASSRQFGQAVLLDERFAYVGQPTARLFEDAGVYIYERDEAGSWVGVDTLTSGVSGDQFGSTLAQSGAYLYVGAPAAGGTGAVYVYRRDEAANAWRQEAVLTSAGLERGSDFGRSLSAEGELLLVGAPREDVLSGAVYVFRRDASGAWAEEARLVDPLRDGGLFGWGLALTGSRAVVGAQYSEGRAGVAYVFTPDGAAGAWSMHSVLRGSAVTAGHRFGRSVAASGDVVVIGAPGANAGSGAAYAYVYNASSDAWVEETILEDAGAAGAGSFGWYVSMDGGNLLVSALTSERTQLFTRDAATGTWTAGALFTNPTPLSGAGFGYVHDLAGGRALIGTLYIERAFLFELESGNAEGTLETTFVGGTASLEAIRGRQACIDGMAGRFPCHDVDLLAFLPVHEIGGDISTGLNDIWGWTDPATGREYALVGRTNGTSFVDVTDPEQPVYLGNLWTQNGRVSGWRDIKVYDHYALIVADAAGDHGLQIFDLNQLAGVTDAPVDFVATALYTGFGSAHNIVVNEEAGFAYAVGSSGPAPGIDCAAGLHIVDLSDPLAPAFAGCFNSSIARGYTHDAQCLRYDGPDPDHAGRDLCVGSDEAGLAISDVTDPANPFELSTVSYPSPAYTHQGWFTEDLRYFLVGDEVDEQSGITERTRTLVFDLQDLDAPQFVGAYLGETPAIDHNLYIRGNKVFASNYTSGVRILDLGASGTLDVSGIEEVGFFDVFPRHDAAIFSGTWSNYPYFASGTVVATGMESGLFVLDPSRAASVARERGGEVPGGFALQPAYPNPFNPQTTIALDVDRPQRVRLSVHDVLGREVAVIHDGPLGAGARHTFTFTAEGLATGVYWIRARGDQLVDVQRVTLLK